MIIRLACLLARLSERIPISAACVSLLLLQTSSAFGTDCESLFVGLPFDAEGVNVINSAGELRTFSLDEVPTVRQLASKPFVVTGNRNYFPGAILMRRERAEHSRADLTSQAVVDIQLQMILNAGLESGAVRDLYRLVRVGSGCLRRHTVALSPMEWQRRWQNATEFRAGDILFVPPIPEQIAVVGAVQQVGLQEYELSASARTYVRQAGPKPFHARLGAALAYLPNGAATSIRVAAWNFEVDTLPPGTVIVVPPWDSNVESRSSDDS